MNARSSAGRRASARKTLGTKPDLSATACTRWRRSSGMSSTSTWPNRLTDDDALLMAVDGSRPNGDHACMAVPEQTRVRLSQWCTTRIPAEERRQRQIGYTIQGDDVTIVDRRAPAYPELGTAWSTTPLARLRADDPEA